MSAQEAVQRLGVSTKLTKKDITDAFMLLEAGWVADIRPVSEVGMDNHSAVTSLQLIVDELVARVEALEGVIVALQGVTRVADVAVAASTWGAPE